MTERYHYLNVLKSLGMFAVLILHVFATPYTYWSETYDSFHKFLAFFIKNILISWAVPVFVMVSGALFLNPKKEISYTQIFKKYVFRLVLVLFTFGLFFSLMENVFYTKAFSLKTLFNSFVDVIKGKTWSHLWFVYMIIGLYVCTPPLKSMLSKMEEKEMLVFLMILFVFLSLLPFIEIFANFNFGFYIPFAGIYIFYFLIGSMLHEEKFFIPTWICFIFIGINVLYVIVGQFIPNNTVVSGARIKFLDNNSPLSVLMSIGIFALLKNCIHQKTNLFDTFFAPISFGVYVVHPIFINFFLKFIKFNPQNYPIYIVNTVLLSVTLIGSIGMVLILRKIPFVRKYIL